MKPSVKLLKNSAIAILCSTFSQILESMTNRSVPLSNHIQFPGSNKVMDRSRKANHKGLNNLNLDLLRRYILMAQTDAGEAIRAFRREI